uniref:Uncharacterized protein n=1 Tax=Arundo donax TaxID=35708 RepID=A0A0A9C3Q5_ARUDO
MLLMVGITTSPEIQSFTSPIPGDIWCSSTAMPQLSSRHWSF